MTKLPSTIITYLTKLPTTLAPNTVLVHNNVRPQIILGRNGFRAWIAPTNAPHLKPCNCKLAGMNKANLPHYTIERQKPCANSSQSSSS